MKANTIDLFENLAQYEYENKYYDLHNDYDCEKIMLESQTLFLTFKNITNDLYFILRFTDVEITLIDFYNTYDIENLTIDLLYRGRFVYNGELFDTSEDGKAYFYLDFVEGQRLEFWAKNVETE